MQEPVEPALRDCELVSQDGAQYQGQGFRITVAEQVLFWTIVGINNIKFEAKLFFFHILSNEVRKISQLCYIQT